MKSPLWVWLAAVIMAVLFPAYLSFLPKMYSVLAWVATIIVVVCIGRYIESRGENKTMRNH